MKKGRLDREVSKLRNNLSKSIIKMFTDFVGIVLVIVNLLLANASHFSTSSPYCWVPDADCTASIKLCYEGGKQELERAAKFDVVNPCFFRAVILPTTCKNQGYSYFIGNDPVLKKLTLWGLPKSKDYILNIL